MKKLVLPILILLILIAGYLYTRKSDTKVPDSNISTYRNSSLGISFKYPKTISVVGDRNRITLHHEVPFEHHDYCDFKGEIDTTIPTLTDFNITISIVESSLIETMKSKSPYIPDENFLNGEIVESPGFIDSVNFGVLKGYKIFEGAEGCGHTVYYLKISDNRTLVIIDDFITIFSGSIDTENMERASAVPGVIKKQQAEDIFNSILNTLVVQ